MPAVRAGPPGLGLDCAIAFQEHFSTFAGFACALAASAAYVLAPVCATPDCPAFACGAFNAALAAAAAAVARATLWAAGALYDEFEAFFCVTAAPAARAGATHAGAKGALALLCFFFAPTAALARTAAIIRLARATSLAVYATICAVAPTAAHMVAYYLAAWASVAVAALAAFAVDAYGHR
jgi:hypothetical protein